MKYRLAFLLIVVFAVLGASSALRANKGRKYEMPDFTGPIVIDDIRAYHSNPGAEHIFYLNFTGGDIHNKFRNYKTVYYDTLYYDVQPVGIDGDYTHFSIEEQKMIYRGWQSFAEPYSLFNVDVTTEKPAQWTDSTVEIVITNPLEGLPHWPAGFSAHSTVGGFGHSTYWVSTELVEWNFGVHEFSHNLGLSNDDGGPNMYEDPNAGDDGHTLAHPIAKGIQSLLGYHHGYSELS